MYMAENISPNTTNIMSWRGPVMTPANLCVYLCMYICTSPCVLRVYMYACNYVHMHISSCAYMYPCSYLKSMPVEKVHIASHWKYKIKITNLVQLQRLAVASTIELNAGLQTSQASYLQKHMKPCPNSVSRLTRSFLINIWRNNQPNGVARGGKKVPLPSNSPRGKGKKRQALPLRQHIFLISILNSSFLPVTVPCTHMNPSITPDVERYGIYYVYTQVK